MNAVFYPWAAQAEITPPRIAGGAGAWFWDENGSRWLDLHAQLGNLALGHQHPALVAAIREQAATLCTAMPSLAADVRDEAAALVASVAPGGDDWSVFFTNGGADATEHALRMARTVTARQKVLAMHRSYHGATDGAISVTGDARRWGAERAAQVVRFSGPYLYRSDFDAPDEATECARALEHLRRLLAYEGPHTVAAVVVEPIVGSNGVLVPPPGYLAGVREICDEHGILLVADEVMCGFGRFGAWFGCDLWNVVPDLMTFAKGVNSGYVPVGGVLVSAPVAEHFAHRPYPGGLTYSGHPLACASIVASIGVLRNDGLVARAADLGQRVVAPALAALAARHPTVGEVRGAGLGWAIELVADRATREPFAPLTAPGALAPRMAAVHAECKAEGVWPLAVANRLHVFPPLVIHEDELRDGIDALDRALKVADRLVEQGAE